jgi:hypothetical protein
MAKTKKVNLFSYLNQIYLKTDKLEYDKKLANPYMLSMWLSHDKKLIDIVNKMNKLQWYMKPEHIYKYYWHKIPKGRRYVKWVKKDIDKGVSDMVQSIKVERKLSTRESRMLENHLSNM